MAFINEYIPKEDLEKYNFAELNKRPRKAGIRPSRSWTIDREADIWLRRFYIEADHTASDGGYTGISGWDFYWGGHLMFLELEQLKFEGGIGEHCCSQKKLLSIDIPPEFEGQRSEILKALEVALTGYKDGGVLSDCSSYTLTFEI